MSKKNKISNHKHKPDKQFEIRYRGFELCCRNPSVITILLVLISSLYFPFLVILFCKVALIKKFVALLLFSICKK